MMVRTVFHICLYLLCLWILIVECQTEDDKYKLGFKAPSSDETTGIYLPLGQETGASGIQKKMLSINQDLKTLARLLETQDVRRTGDARRKLRILGKRERRPRYLSFFLKGFYQKYPTGFTSSDEDKGRKRGGPRLSVSGALTAIADMVQAQSRRRMFQEIASNRASLSNIGKRSEIDPKTFTFPEVEAVQDDTGLDTRIEF